MTIQLGLTVANAMLDQFETTIGVSAIMKIRTGAQPASAAAADSGTVIATIALPADWLTAAAGGSKAKLGTWQDASADATGICGHYRIYDSGGAVCHEQGSVTATGGGGDMTVDNINVNASQSFTVTSYTRSLPV